MSLDVNTLPQFKCHKVVRAAKIITIIRGEGVILVLENFGGVTVPRDWYDKHSPRVNGYFVVYEDGYQSYSPAEAFESGYSPVTEQAVTQ